ncbi:MAG: hypothetical protein ABFC63_08690 [Thermoguttaceae bacterium]
MSMTNSGLLTLDGDGRTTIQRISALAVVPRFGGGLSVASGLCDRYRAGPPARRQPS